MKKQESKKRRYALLVEEDIILCAFYSSILDGLKVDHRLAEHGRQGLEHYIAGHEEDTPFDLVISDVTMPNMEGKEMAQKIRNYESANNLSRCGLYAIISDEHDLTELECLDYGFDDYIRKHSSAKDIQRIVQRHYLRSKT